MIVTVECVIDRHIYISIFTGVIGFIVLIGAHIKRSKYNATASKMVSIGTCRHYNESHVNIRHLFHFIAPIKIDYILEWLPRSKTLQMIYN